MRTGKRLGLSLLLWIACLSGCAALPLFSFLPIMGTAYEGYAIWRSGEATKHYAVDPDMTYRAVMRASDQLKLDAALLTEEPQGEYLLEVKGSNPMMIRIFSLDKGITTVAITIPVFGDKQFVDLFYRLVDDNLRRKPTADKVSRRTLSMPRVHQMLWGAKRGYAVTSPFFIEQMACS